MFVQVIEGTTGDPEAVHQQLEVWQRDLMPGAIGYLGSTGGCTANGDCILIARFESREAAMRNGERPEQTAWWRETEKCFTAPVVFHDSEDVNLMMHGDPNQSHFVQVMEGHVTDRERVEALEREADPMLATMRPELLGAVTAYFDDGEYTEIAYFTSEAEARAGETMEVPGEVAERMAEWGRMKQVERFLDISDPWLVGA